MQLVPRSEWGAPPTTAAGALTTAKGVKIHWIGEKNYRTGDHAQCPAKVRAIRQAHLDHPAEDWVDIAYNHLCCQHGWTFEGRGTGRQSGANGSRALNERHYAVCAILGMGETATPELLHALADTVDLLRQSGAGPELLGHRDGYATDCPGDALEAWVKAGGRRPDAPTPPPAPAPTPPPPAPAPTPPPPAPRPTAPAWPGQYLTATTRSEAALRWQAQMHRRGWTITVDGWYGPASASICRQFQQDSSAHGWPLAADGIVGPATWRATWERPVS